MHNLFGDTNAVHITFNKKTNYKIDTVINGDATWESLKYVQYEGPEILKRVRDNLEKDVALQKVSIEESSHFPGAAGQDPAVLYLPGGIRLFPCATWDNFE